MPLYQSYTDQRLIELLRSGSAEAFEEIFNRYWLVVYRRFFKKLQSKTIAEECTQELFTRLWERKHELVVTTSLIQYFNGAVRNMVVNAIRQEVKNKILHETVRHDVSLVDVDDEQLVVNLHRALSDLPGKTGNIIKLSKLEGLSVKEIAEQQALSNKAVEYHITKALKMLRDYFKKVK
ncbi:RNA polymerase sigma factor [Chryseolinea lacunae]|uniref:Sigma-70 family RNA polymerase sigma factor n=1 Tax=Chryseolinea lacunae TaxID=2801331 RepID=A0ABS1KMA0_9BACT|nr:sigma-70 family RNA polymerase sigma factor [Chryseolinea lacunae]MBL0740589.1 sigma-70 family RNA polymerase sigma factor [Chryseolinea lacunae]